VTPVIIRLKKFSQPNVTAQIYWLKNRKRETWRDKPPIIENYSNENQDNSLIDALRATVDEVWDDYIDQK